MLESNQRPLRCERSALTAALIALAYTKSLDSSRPSWATLGSNQRPLPCQGSALPLRQPPNYERDLKRWARESNSPTRLCRPLPNRLANPPHLIESTQGPSSGQRDSDPRSRPWQGRALPTKLWPHALEALPQSTIKNYTLTFCNCKSTHFKPLIFLK